MSADVSDPPSTEPPEGRRRRLLPLALGVEALRRQTAREYPDASREHHFRHVREWASGVGARAAGGARGSTSEDRVRQLERLVELRDAGELDASEFEREKQRLLGTSAATGG